jgi:hypothetical protein
MTVSPFRRRPERFAQDQAASRWPRLRANNAWASKNVKELAEISGMRRDGLYKTFGSGKKDPQLSRILSLFEGMDVRIVVKPLPARAKPPRPKLGRPRSSSKNRQRPLNEPRAPKGFRTEFDKKGLASLNRAFALPSVPQRGRYPDHYRCENNLRANANWPVKFAFRVNPPMEPLQRGQRLMRV